MLISECDWWAPHDPEGGKVGVMAKCFGSGSAHSWAYHYFDYIAASTGRATIEVTIAYTGGGHVVGTGVSELKTVLCVSGQGEESDTVESKKWVYIPGLGIVDVILASYEVLSKILEQYYGDSSVVRRHTMSRTFQFQQGHTYVIKAGLDATVSATFLMAGMRAVGKVESIKVIEHNTPSPKTLMTGRDPGDTQSEVPVDSEIKIWFSRPVDTASVEKAFLISPFVTGTFSWEQFSHGGVRMTFKPAGLLQYQTDYTVTIDPTAKDSAGLPILPRGNTWGFTTVDLCGKEVGIGWNFTHYFVGNWTDDGIDDLIVRKSNGEMWLYPFSKIEMSFVSSYRKKVADGWNFTHYFVGNWTDDGIDDFVVRDSKGTLWLYQLNNKEFGKPVQVGHGFNFKDYFVGNWTDDGIDDLICRDFSEGMFLYPFRNNTFYDIPGSGKQVGHGFWFNDYFVGNWTGNGTADLIGRDSNGEMFLFPFDNDSFYGAPDSGKKVGHGFICTHYFVGNWTGNGTDDLIVRDSNGNLRLFQFYDNSFYGITDQGRIVASGFNFTHHFVGNWTGDGTDDFICRDKNGTMWLYPFHDKDISCA